MHRYLSNAAVEERLFVMEFIKNHFLPWVLRSTWTAVPLPRKGHWAWEDLVTGIQKEILMRESVFFWRWRTSRFPEKPLSAQEKRWILSREGRSTWEGGRSLTFQRSILDILETMKSKLEWTERWKVYRLQRKDGTTAQCQVCNKDKVHTLKNKRLERTKVEGSTEREKNTMNLERLVEIEWLESDTDGLEVIAVVNREAGFGVNRFLVCWWLEILYWHEYISRASPYECGNGCVLGKQGRFCKAGITNWERFEAVQVVQWQYGNILEARVLNGDVPKVVKEVQRIEGKGREGDVAAASTLNGEVICSDWNAFDGVGFFGDGEVDEVVIGVSDLVA